MRSRNNRRFASVFSGCGGFDLGFVQAGFSCVAAVDIDPRAVEVHNSNLKSNAYVCDLSNGDTPFTRAGEIDVLLAGPPCQGFSTAGKRRFDDPRNHLLMAAGRIAKLVKPKVFIAENVAGITAEPHISYWNSLRDMLRGEGYKTTSLVCNGTAMGVPQIRRRVVLVAWNTGNEIDFNLPVVEGGTVRTALADIKDLQNHEVKRLRPGTDLYRVAKRIQPGQKLSNVRGGPRSVHTWDIPEVFGKTTLKERRLLELLMHVRRQRRVRDVGDADPVPKRFLENKLGRPVEDLLCSLLQKGYVRRIGHDFDLNGTFNGKFRRLRWDRPSLTVDTRFGNPRYFLHPDEQRGFTVREAARIQGFPDTFHFSGSEISQFRLIGNAVPPPLAKCLAGTILNLLA